ncbi:MAG: head GIN domain-containing protein [Chloroflexota bacterium]
MKKLFVFPLILLLALSLSACGMVRGSGRVIDEERSVGDFDKIMLAGIGEVILTQGEEISLKIEAEDNLMRYLKTEVHGDTLVLGTKEEYAMLALQPTRPLKFYITVTDLEAITVAGSGDVYADTLLEVKGMALTVLGSGNIRLEQIETDDISVNITGSGEIEVDSLTSKALTTTISGSGECSLEGEVTDQTVKITGSGSFWGRNLQSENASVLIAGSGDGEIHVRDDLDVNIIGSGNLRYTGSPRLSQSISGSGDVSNVP